MKQSNKKQVSLRLDPKLVARAQAVARREERTFTQVIERALRRAFGIERELEKIK